MKEELLKKANECLLSAKSKAEEIAKDERVQKASSKAKEYAEAAKSKAEEIARDERVQAVRTKVEDCAKNVKEKVVEVAHNEKVVAAKNKAVEYALPWWRKLCTIAEPVLKKEGTQKVIRGVRGSYDWTCSWTRANWQAGRNGRIKVIAATVVLVFVVGSLFSMCVGSSGEKSATDGDDALEAFATLRGEAVAHVWMCDYCDLDYTSESKPSDATPHPCPHGYAHWWLDKGPAGSTPYKCHHCQKVLYTETTPWSGGKCKANKYSDAHWWIEQHD